MMGFIKTQKGRIQIPESSQTSWPKGHIVKPQATMNGTVLICINCGQTNPSGDTSCPNG